jgi:hypothetical protein
LKRDSIAEPEGTRIGVTLTQSEVASLLGATRESINKTLGHFRRIKPPGQIVAMNRDALRDPSM